MMRFIGFTTILVLTAAAANLAQSVASNAEFVALVGQFSPWAAAHSKQLGYGAAGVIALIGISLPILLAQKDADGGDRLEVLGFHVGTVAVAFVLVAALPAAAWLLGMGWFAAKAAFAN